MKLAPNQHFIQQINTIAAGVIISHKLSVLERFSLEKILVWSLQGESHSPSILDCKCDLCTISTNNSTQIISGRDRHRQAHFSEIRTFCYHAKDWIFHAWFISSNTSRGWESCRGNVLWGYSNFTVLQQLVRPNLG